MDGFWRKKVFSVPAAIILALIVAFLSSGITYYASRPAQGQSSLSAEDLYYSAVLDAMVAEEDEIMPLVAITKDSGMVRWNQSEDRVLLATWHRYPDSYPPGAEVTLAWGDVWVFSEKEIRSWCEKGNLDRQDEILRLEQLIGLPPHKGYTHFTTMWVNPDDLFRPSCDNEIDDTTVELAFDQDTDEDYINWFNDNIIDSYYPANYPWTRLGYTYDWADNDTEYGLSEFVVKGGAKVTVENTYANEQFLARLKS